MNDTTKVKETYKWHLPGFPVSLQEPDLTRNILHHIDAIVGEHLNLFPPPLAALLDETPRMIGAIQPIDFVSLNEKTKIYWYKASTLLYFPSKVEKDNGLTMKWFPREEVWNEIPDPIKNKYPKQVVKSLNGIILDSVEQEERMAWT